MISLKPFKIVAAYAIVSALWIVLSDRAVSALFGDSVGMITLVSTFKGWSYVVVMSVMLYGLIKRYQWDISQRYQETLKSEERFAEAMDATSDGLWDWNIASNEVYYSPSYWRMLGYDAEDMSGHMRSWDDLIHPDDRERVLGLNLDCIENRRKDFAVEFRMRGADGKWRWILGRGKAVVRGQDGRALRLIGTHVDFTERKRAEEALALSEAQHRGIFEQAAAGICHCDMEGAFLRVNHRLEQMLGRDEAELLRLRLEDLTHPEDLAGTVERMRWLAQGESSGFDAEQRCLRRDGSVIWVHMSISCIHDVGNGPRICVGVFVDVTERTLAEQAFRESEGRFRRMVDTANEGIWILDGDIRTTYVNGTMETILGYPPEEMLGRGFSAFLYQEDLPEHECQMADRKSGASGHYERRFRRKDGSEVWCLVSSSPLEDESGAFQGSFAMITDITERKELEKQLLYRALHDPLTGLANRTLCMDRIAQAGERAARKPGGAFAVVFVDLDRFKFINDSLGHEAGDIVLREVAGRLLACARKADTVCRYGGDEFILVLEDLGKRQVVRIINRVRASLKKPMQVESHEIQLAASFGIAYAPQENCQPEDLMRNANIALHSAKNSGRDKIVAYRAGMHEAAIHTLSLQTDMHNGLENGEFFMVYQPIFDLRGAGLVGFEALLRWNHPQRGLIGPAEFIPQAEEYGFIFALGNFALRQACSDMARLLRETGCREPLTMAVNLSPRQFSRPGLAEHIEQALAQTGLPLSLLVLEITESSIMKYPEASAHILARLKNKGVGIAIDDFGTGYSSMSVLQRLPLDRLKVDMSFVRRMMASRQDYEIIRAIVTLAHSLNLKTVAEGIETDEQRDSLRAIGCDYGQGYLCSRPVALERLPEIIRGLARPGVACGTAAG